MNTVTNILVVIIVFATLSIGLVHCGGEEAELTEAPVFLSADGEIMRECLREALAIVKLETNHLLPDPDTRLTTAAIIAVPLFEERIGRDRQ